MKNVFKNEKYFAHKYSKLFIGYPLATIRNSAIFACDNQSLMLWGVEIYHFDQFLLLTSKRFFGIRVGHVLDVEDFVILLFRYTETGKISWNTGSV